MWVDGGEGGEKVKEGKNKVTDEDGSMRVGKASQQHIEGVQNGRKRVAFWHRQGWKSCPKPFSPASHLFSHIWMWFLLIFQALQNDSQTGPLKNYVLLAELYTLVHDVVAERYALTNTLTAPKPSRCMLLSTARQVMWQVAPLSTVCFWCVLACPSSCCMIVRCETSVETVEVWGLSLGLPTNWNNRGFRHHKTPGDLL